MKRPALLLSALLLLAAPALAAPSIDSLEWKLEKKGRRIAAKVRVTLAGPGEITLSGEVNGIPVEKTKRIGKGGVRKARFRVNSRRLGLRRLAGPLLYDLAVTASEVGGASTSRELRVRRPVPLLILPGLGNETGGSSVEALAASLALDWGYETEGRRPSLVVHGYDSLTTPLPEIGQSVERSVETLLRGSPFDRVDIVGFSMGGLAARSYLTIPGAEGRVRKCVLAATPNEGTPLAYLAVQASGTGLLDDVPLLGDLGDMLLSTETKEALRLFYPTYPWLFVTVPVLGRVSIGEFLPESDPPLAALNAEAPHPDVDYHAIAYRDVGAGAFELPGGTVETVDLTELLGDDLDFAALLAGDLDLLSILASGDLDLTALASGEGDGLVPIRSAFMEDVPLWRDRLTTHDMGGGTHLTMMLDPEVADRIAEILAGR